jgi:hypothetical protein
MNEIDYFKVFVLYSSNVVDDVDHLHVKKIYLINLFYIIIEDIVDSIFIYFLLGFFGNLYLFTLLNFRVQLWMEEVRQRWIMPKLRASSPINQRQAPESMPCPALNLVVREEQQCPKRRTWLELLSGSSRCRLQQWPRSSLAELRIAAQTTSRGREVDGGGYGFKYWKCRKRLKWSEKIKVVGPCRVGLAQQQVKFQVV